MQPDVREFYRERLGRATERVDTRIVLQMHRIVWLTIDEIFVSLTARRSEKLPRPLQERPGPGAKTSTGKQPDLAFFERAETVQRPNVPIDEILATSPQAVLLGDPGSGKTTLLRKIAHRWAAQGASDVLFATSADKVPSQLAGFLPVYLELRYFAQELSANPSLRLEDYLARAPWDWAQDRAADVGELIAKHTRDGRCLFLFDGLDEAIDKNLRVRVVDEVDGLLSKRPGCRCVVTSRVVGYELSPMPDTFQVTTLEPFTPRQTCEFFQKWALAIERQEDIKEDDFTRKRAKARADDILRGLGYDPARMDQEDAERADPAKRRLQELAQNPMLCTLIGLIHHQGKRMPEDRVELYQHCVEAFIYDWEIQKRIRKVAPDKASAACDYYVAHHIRGHKHGYIRAHAACPF